MAIIRILILSIYVRQFEKIYLSLHLPIDFQILLRLVNQTGQKETLTKARQLYTIAFRNTSIQGCSGLSLSANRRGALSLEGDP